MLPITDHNIKKIKQLITLMKQYTQKKYNSNTIKLPIDQYISNVLTMITPKNNKKVTIEPNLTTPNTIIKKIHEKLQQTITNLTQNTIDTIKKKKHV